MKKRKHDGSTLTGLNGMFMGGGDGAIWQVFAPRWFELGRWLWWLFYRGPKGTVRISGSKGEGVDVRIFRTERSLPRVPTARAVRQNGNERFNDATTK